ncbi:chemotaxis protein CheD [Sphingomonas nostoxanthinifaciens]|uniref:chemotaxis protein CheD n=1 Tax=Sphingomonas nostoxanthinifaciens TaxID=2872652 RepID=UPI001CC1EF26|nr:chemotaxis protein CheD [Sphingomonas nostoxanthinifaciens]UAK26044.1 chemotaxis protein CheD [Sphingomonas nostoxanthinifaciens]
MNAPAPRDQFRRINVIQGESRVTGDPQVVFTTVLGSCIAACLFDPEAKVGGINHFLLAEPGGMEPDARSMQRYGVYAMEVLINAMLAKGAQRHRLRARLYGGATMHRTFRDIGGSNARFARQFLRDENIMLVAEDVGGFCARRVEFRAGLGLSRSRSVTDTHVPPPQEVVRPPAPQDDGDVEFF